MYLFTTLISITDFFPLGISHYQSKLWNCNPLTCKHVRGLWHTGCTSALNMYVVQGIRQVEWHSKHWDWQVPIIEASDIHTPITKTSEADWQVSIIGIRLAHTKLWDMTNWQIRQTDKYVPITQTSQTAWQDSNQDIRLTDKSSRKTDKDQKCSSV